MTTTTTMIPHRRKRPYYSSLPHRTTSNVQQYISQWMMMKSVVILILPMLFELAFYSNPNNPIQILVDAFYVDPGIVIGGCCCERNNHRNTLYPSRLRSHCSNVHGLVPHRSSRCFWKHFAIVNDDMSDENIQSGGNTDEDGRRQQQQQEQNRGFGVLLTVPIAWGSYEPAVRLVYSIQPNIPPFLFSFVYYVIATTALTTLQSLMTTSTTSSSTTSKDQHQQQYTSAGGFELGTYLFVGNALQVIGLQNVASDRAAFELQLTTILVPIVQSIVAKDIRLITVRTWTACFVALAGVALIGLDGSSAASAVDSNGQLATATTTTTTVPDLYSILQNVSFSTGDLCIMLGALFYTFHCIRLEVYAKRTQPIQLASSKATTETGWSALVLGLCVLTAILLQSNEFGSSSPIPSSTIDLARSSGDNVIQYVESVSITNENFNEWVQVGAATVWTGLVTVAYTIAAQSYGQARVPATTANLIYTVQPFFTAVIAYLLLGERLGSFGYAGGILIGAAVLLVIQPSESSEITGQ